MCLRHNGDLANAAQLDHLQIFWPCIENGDAKVGASFAYGLNRFRSAKRQKSQRPTVLWKTLDRWPEQILKRPLASSQDDWANCLSAKFA